MNTTGQSKKRGESAGRRGKGRTLAGALLLALMLASTAVPAGMAADASLPGGTSISVEITSPVDGQTFMIPGGDPTGVVDVTVEGTAAIGEGASPATVVYVIDLSASTLSPENAGDCGGDLNGDGLVDTILDCQIAALLALNEAVVAAGSASLVGIVGYGLIAGAADMSPDAGHQLLVAPDADGFVATVLTSAQSSTTFGAACDNTGFAQFTLVAVNCDGTNFDAALHSVVGVVDASLAAGNEVHSVIFLSDGRSNRGTLASFNAALDDLVARDTLVHAFAVGPEAVSSCDGGTVGTMDAMAAATGGSCTQVEDPDNLPDVLPGFVSGTLDAITLEVDGGPVAIDVADTLPLAGADATTWDTVLMGLGAGTYVLCATAEGTDAGGTGDVEDCVTIHVVADGAVGECPSSQGFWKNHAGNGPQPDEWPVDNLDLGDHNYDKEALLELLDMPVQGDASIRLAKQLIAAKLNFETGLVEDQEVEPGRMVSDVIDDADALIGDAMLPAGITGPAGQEWNALKDILDDFNNGIFTPGCSE